MKDAAAIEPLIAAVRTSHTYKTPPSQAGNTSVGFGSGPGGSPGGLSLGGGGPRTVNKVHNNQSVVDALEAITGMNFGFNQAAWRNWYEAQRVRVDVNVRRDNPSP
jgi:hypothetical protein